MSQICSAAGVRGGMNSPEQGVFYGKCAQGRTENRRFMAVGLSIASIFLTITNISLQSAHFNQLKWLNTSNTMFELSHDIFFSWMFITAKEKNTNLPLYLHCQNSVSYAPHFISPVYLVFPPGFMKQTMLEVTSPADSLDMCSFHSSPDSPLLTLWSFRYLSPTQLVLRTWGISSLPIFQFSISSSLQPTL